MGKRLSDIAQALENTALWNDPKQAQTLLKEQTLLLADKSKLLSLENKISEARLFLQWAKEENGIGELQEAQKIIDSLEADIESLELTKLLSGPTDKNAALLSVNAGAGGVDAQDFADMLRRMYIRWAERHGFSIEELDLQDGDEAGIKSCTLLIGGDFAYGYLKGEVGVHRLVRISPFDSNARRHTSFAAVFVYPEFDDTIDVEIREEDLEIQTMRSGGAGGQHVNKTESAVRVLHKPSGFVVKCQSERSQHQNKARAIKMLKGMIYNQKVEEQEASLKQAHGQKKAIEWGSQIRSYVMAPYQLVADHRFDWKNSQVQAVLDGDLDEVMKIYLRSHQAKK